MNQRTRSSIHKRVDLKRIDLFMLLTLYGKISEQINFGLIVQMNERELDRSLKWITNAIYEANDNNVKAGKIPKCLREAVKLDVPVDTNALLAGLKEFISYTKVTYGESSLCGLQIFFSNVNRLTTNPPRVV